MSVARVDPVRLEVFRHMLTAIAEEMGSVLERSAYSANIKERRDFSCAVFDADGRLIAQAAHIPVHLGAMPLSVRAALEAFPDLEPDDVVILNDPYRGGTHLPDVTLIYPVFIEGRLTFFTANRAHQSDIGGMTPGSMPLASEIFQEGLILPPVRLYRRGARNEDLWRVLLANVRTPEEREGDLLAQVYACRVGAQRLQALVGKYGPEEVLFYSRALLDYSEALMRHALAQIPEGTYTFEDSLDDDGFSETPVRIRVAVTIQAGQAVVDFTGSDPQCQGSVNAVYAVTLSAVRYCFRALLEGDAPTNDGLFRPITVVAPEGTVVHARPPAPVSAGNVETSQRIVDVVLGALAQAVPDRIPAAAQGTMNNLTFGGVFQGRPFAFYETIGGGAGAGPHGDGESAIHTHMTNTMNTPVEAIERLFPVRIRRYSIRWGSGGEGLHRGGDGIVREVEFLAPARVGLISDRRKTVPYGLAGGRPGQPGRNRWIRADGTAVDLPGKFQVDVQPGDVLSIETPGGGGWGSPSVGDWVLEWGPDTPSAGLKRPSFHQPPPPPPPPPPPEEPPPPKPELREGVDGKTEFIEDTE